MSSALSKEAVGDLVERCTVLAALLEVSGYPKPGNVHRTRDAAETRFEHFLAGGIAIGPAMRTLAEKGYDAGTSRLDISRIGLGSKILRACQDSLSWQRGGNVNLGVVLLLAPLAATSGLYLSKRSHVDLHQLRRDLEAVIMAAVPEDSVWIYRAIRAAVPPRVLGRVEELDVMDDSALTRIREEGLTPLQIFEDCQGRDSICGEWVTGFSVTFTLGYPALKEALQKSGDINMAVVHAFLRILSEVPDSLIERKSEREAALEVSRMASEALKRGGLTNPEGKKAILEMDETLHKAGGNLNPGTTADLTAASLYLLLFEGWRP
jgi:triphosphoribosyl-dephospho-CoA synthase